MDDDQVNTIDRADSHDFKPHRVTWKTFAVLFIVTVVVCYLLAWKIVKGPVNLTYRANSLLIGGRIEESLENFEKALDGNPRLKMAWTGRGLCLMYLGRYEEALTSYDRALMLDPALASAWQGKGMSFEHLGRFDDALVCYEKGLTISPDNGEMLRMKYRLKNRTSGAGP